MSDAVPPLRLYVGGAVPLDNGVYIVRRTDAELLRAVRGGEYCNILCPRQMGKTSAIMRIRAELRDEGYRTARIDIAGDLGTPDSAAEWYVGLLSQLSDQCGLGLDVQGWWDASTKPTPNQKLIAFLRNEVLGRFPDHFVVFLDEIEHTLNLPYTDDFFLAIRSLYNDRAAEPDLRRLAFCLVGAFSPNELVKRQRTTTYNVGRSFEFHDFDPARDDLAPLERTLSVDPARGAALLEAVLRWTGGQPYLTASVCRKVVDAGISSREGVNQLVGEQFLTHEAFESNDQIHFDTISRFLAQRVAARLETAELYRRILRGEPERESTSSPVVALKLSGLVKTDGKGRLRVRNRIYRHRFGAEWATAVLSLGERPSVAGPRVRGARTSGATRMVPAGEVWQPLPSRIRIFISHASQDDAFVRHLREVLDQHGQAGWIDSRELRGGDPLWPEIQRAIESASAFAVVVSPASLQSEWVGDELAYALELQNARGRNAFPVIPISLDGTKLGVLKRLFGEEPRHIPVNSAAGGIEAALNDVLVALHKRLPAEPLPTPQPPAEPLEELVLELTDLGFCEHEGVTRASASARLVHQPATQGRREVESARWRLIAPLGPIEAGELHWYLEQYAVWPSTYFRDRARKVEESLVTWGRLLHDTAMPAAHTAAVMQSWADIDGRAARRFSVYVDGGTEIGAPEDEAATAREAAAALLALPWELLHDGNGFLFQGAKPTRVRRRLPNTQNLDVAVVATPIRILLITARPEDDACGYIDHRVSALPLVDAMEALPGLVHIHVLDPPTLPALRKELDRARSRGEPYHVVHFDGHGVYDRRVGLGALCFEDPRDAGKLERRRHEKVFTDDFGAMLRDHRVPLVFLEACQTAQAEQASESVAAALLGAGVKSVVTMSHSVLVETARRFVEAFYDALAEGARVGGAMLAGQRRLKDDPSRGRVFGAEELRLQDWFVPVLFQERDDPQLFRGTPSRQTQEDYRRALQLRLGELPGEPATGFVGRSRDLLAVQRLLRRERYAVVRGQGGEGKTALAAEVARWMVRSQQVRRAAFVSVETHSHAAAVLDAIGRQLAREDYSVATFSDLEQALLPVERALREQETLLVVDNMESVLLPPFVAAETPDALTEDARRALDAILELCARLNAIGETRLVFTSREALPAPFDGERHRIELHQLDREDAVKLVERVLNANAGGGPSNDALREEIEQLVDAVNRHAHTLALLAPSLRSRGVEATRQSLVELMAQMEREFPGSREQSVFASVELSLRRLSPANREKAQVLGLFHGAIDLDVLRVMMQWEPPVGASLAAELVETGLATFNSYNHLTLHPALCPYLRGQMDPAEHEAMTARWIPAMRGYVAYLARERHKNTEIAATLTVLDLPNLFALLDEVLHAGDEEATIELATSLFTLLQELGRPQLLERVAGVSDAAAEALGAAWNHALFEAQRTRIEHQLAGGRLPEAIEGARQLLQRAQAAGEQAYLEADYDLAMANFLLGHILKNVGGADQALPFFQETQERFEAIERDRPGRGAERMASVCLTERGDCLRALGRLDEAATAYEEALRRDESQSAKRDIAVVKGRLGIVRLLQRRYPEALESFAEARERFAALDEPGSVALFWNQTGRVLQEVGQAEAAEDAYRKSLALWVRLGDVTGAARALSQLGSLYAEAERAEEALVFYRQAVDRYVEVLDTASESRVRTDLAAALLMLRRLDEARHEILRAIEIQGFLGHAAEPWKPWDILATIETDAGNATAAAEAARKAIAFYLAYRRDGGENHFGDGRLALAVTQALSADRADQAASLLQQIAADSEAAWLHPFIRALQAIIAGSREPSLADAPELGYRMAAEILLLLEVLEAAPRSQGSEVRVRAQSRGGSEATRARRGTDGDRLAGVNSRIGLTSEAVYDRKDST
jgi:tetratricopeptide (TPR) repeat protein